MGDSLQAARSIPASSRSAPFDPEAPETIRSISSRATPDRAQGAAQPAEPGSPPDPQPAAGAVGSRGAPRQGERASGVACRLRATSTRSSTSTVAPSAARKPLRRRS